MEHFVVGNPVKVNKRGKMFFKKNFFCMNSRFLVNIINLAQNQLI